MDYQLTATGIVKNAELYDLYYNQYLTKEHAIPELTPEFFANRIAGSVAILYFSNNIGGGHVFSLFGYLRDVMAKREPMNDLRDMLEDISKLIRLTNYSYIPSYMSFIHSLDSYDYKSEKRSLKERIKIKIALRKIKKTAVQLTNHIEKVNKRLRRDGYKVDAVSYLANNQKAKNQSKIDSILEKYRCGEMLRYRTSIYTDVLAPYFKETRFRTVVESVLDDPETAKKAYGFALEAIDRNVLKLLATHDYDRKKDLDLLNKYRKKYSLLYSIANCSTTDLELLKEQLKKTYDKNHTNKEAMAYEKAYEEQ